MDDFSLLLPIVQKWSQNIPDMSAAIKGMALFEIWEPVHLPAQSQAGLNR